MMTLTTRRSKRTKWLWRSLTRPMQKAKYSNSIKRDLPVAEQHWHDVRELDTFSSPKGIITCAEKSEFHKKRVQIYSNRECYGENWNSSSYLEYYDNTGLTMGLTLYKRARCKCIVSAKFHECSDETMVQMSELLKGIMKIQHINKNLIEICPCPIIDEMMNMKLHLQRLGHFLHFLHVLPFSDQACTELSTTW